MQRYTELAITIFVLLAVLIFGTCRIIKKEEPDFTYIIDPTIVPVQNTVPRPSEGIGQPVAVVIDTTGNKDIFVANEVILYAPDTDILKTFSQTYSAEILSDGKLPELTEELLPDMPSAEDSEESDSYYYLLRVNLDRADVSNFASWMSSLGLRGAFRFSSEEAVRLCSIIAKERVVNDLEATFNMVVMPQSPDCVLWKTEEHETGNTDPSRKYMNAMGFLFREMSDPKLQVSRAWQYMDLLEASLPTKHLWLAVIDSGFALNEDFPLPKYIPQLDLIENGNSVTDKPNKDDSRPCERWHGTCVMGVATARLNNRFGSAGTGGQIAVPMLFRTSTDYDDAKAIETAVKWNAQVINISMGHYCGSVGNATKCSNYTQSATKKARDAGVIVVACSGNDRKNLDQKGLTFLPCEAEGVLGVGAIYWDSKLSVKESSSIGSNYGSNVDIWAPGNLMNATPNPDKSGVDYGDFGGTSAASPYIAGIVAMMKAIKPSISFAEVQTVLQSTAHKSTDPLVANGYVNAYAAIKQVADSVGLKPQGDSHEPNDSYLNAHPIAPGGNLTATIAPGDYDNYYFETKDFTDIQLEVAYRVASYAPTHGPNNSLKAVLDKMLYGSGDKKTGKIKMKHNMLPPGRHILLVEGQTPDSINCYDVALSHKFSTILPDRFDDEKPAGEKRNDEFTARTVIPDPVKATPTPTEASRIYDLNFDKTDDIDYFEITLDPGTNKPINQWECLKPKEPSTGFDEGHLEIYANSYIPWDPSYVSKEVDEFEIKVYYADGSEFTNHKYKSGYSLRIDCPHDHFKNGHIFFSIRGKNGQRKTSYSVTLHYTQWKVLHNIPSWVWTLPEPPLLRIFPPFRGQIPWIYPSNPEIINRVFSGEPFDDLPIEYGIIYWEEQQDFDLYLSTKEPGHHLDIKLYDVERQVIGKSEIGDDGVEGHIHLPQLSPGTYLLGIGPGDFATMYSVSIGPELQSEQD